MKVWLDDVRPAPTGWIWARWPYEVIEHILTGDVTHVSLDHDLGDDSRGTGYDVILHIEEAASRGIKPPVVFLHTANPVARKRMQQGLDAIARITC